MYNFHSRFDRACSQSMFILNHNERKNTYLVHGHSSSEYSIKVSEEICSCTCPDFENHHPQFCKHIILVLMSSHGCSESEIQKFSSGMSMNFTKSPKQVFHITSSEDCPICMLEMKTNLSQCVKCEKVFHRVCVQKWFRTADHKKCPMCRGKF